MAKFRKKYFNYSVLKNKITKGLFIVGNNAVQELANNFPSDFEAIIIPQDYNSSKVQKVIDIAYKSNIELYYDSDAINWVKKEIDLDYSGILGILKRNVERFTSFKDIEQLISSMPQCTAVAFSDIDFEQNIGTIIRTSLALNADFILVSNRQQKMFSPVVTKVSMGYNHVIPIVRENFLLAIDSLKKIDFQIIGLDMEGENLSDFSYNPKVCFVIGNEGRGVGEGVAKKCDKIVAIPISEDVESLNVSTSLAIALYDRNFKLKR